MHDAYDRLLGLAHAGASVLHLASYEWERVQGSLIGIAKELGLPLRVWSSSRGLASIDEAGLHPERDDVDLLDLLREIDGSREPGIWLVEDAHPYLDARNFQVVRQVRQLCRMKAAPRRLLVLNTPLPGLPQDLHKEVPTVELPLPGRDVLRQVCERAAEGAGVPVDLDDEALIDAARGLTVMEAELAFRQAASKRGRLDGSAVPDIVREKERVIRQSQVLEYYDPDASIDQVGGLEMLKEWLNRRGRAFGAGARDYGLDAPKGVLLLGVQGCGKSLVAKAIASAWRFPLLRFDMGKVYGGLVGQSEGNIRVALQVSEALAPCVLWIDEIEKGMAGLGSSGQSDAGTAARVVGTFLTWMQEKRQPVFVVATANRIDQLPPELLRKGRFDEIFFVDLPSEAARRDILSIHLRRKGRDPKQFDVRKLTTAAVGFSGAELEEAIREGLFAAFAEGRELADHHVLAAMKATYPLSSTMREEIDGLRRWAKVRARLATNDQPEVLPEGDAATPRLPQESRNPFVPTGK